MALSDQTDKLAKVTADGRPVINIISDSLGDSAATMAIAAARQFSENCLINRLPKVYSLAQIRPFIAAHLNETGDDMILFHTIADEQLRAELDDYLIGQPVVAVDLIGPAIDAIALATGRVPKGLPGLQRVTDERYFDRVAAMEYAVIHDDGRNADHLEDADIVLIGVSRTSKTPLSIYLASEGYKVANIPLATGIEPPPQLFTLDRRRIFGLTSDIDLLSDIRKRRLGEAVVFAPQYANPLNVSDDLDQARQLMRKLGCIVIRTDNRAIEECAQEIIRYLKLAFGES